MSGDRAAPGGHSGPESTSRLPPDVPERREVGAVSGEELSARAWQLVQDPDSLRSLVRRYSEPRNGFGHVVSRDNAKDLFYPAATPEYRVRFNDAISEAAGVVATSLYARRLTEPLGATGFVVFTCGGTGSGKTTVATSYEPHLHADIVVDSQGTNADEVIRRVEQALSSGRRVTRAYVYRDAVDAWIERIVPRAVETGRPVTIAGHVMSHRDALQAAVIVTKHFAGERRVHLDVFENASGGARLVPAATALDMLQQKAQTYEESHVRHVLEQFTRSALEAECISAELHAALV